MSYMADVQAEIDRLEGLSPKTPYERLKLHRLRKRLASHANDNTHNVMITARAGGRSHDSNPTHTVINGLMITPEEMAGLQRLRQWLAGQGKRSEALESVMARAAVGVSK